MTLQPCHWRAGVGPGTSPLEMLVCAADDKVVVGSVVPTLGSQWRPNLIRTLLGQVAPSPDVPGKQGELLTAVWVHGLSHSPRSAWASKEQ